ncbi:MAG: branched-chain amino acid ABC transporter permease [Pseudothermotoga sp.]
MKRFLNWKILFLVMLIAVAIFRPYAFFYGLQRGSLYSLVALPLALILGIVGLLNLAHGDFLTLGLYLGYVLFNQLHFDPIFSVILIGPFLFLVGLAVYKSTVERVLKSHHLNLLLITFGISITLVELVNLLWTSRPRNVYVPYAARSVNILGISVGAYEFLYVAAAFLVLLTIMFILKKTRFGQAAFAVGQNPKGAAIVGINVRMVYTITFSLATAMIAVSAALMMPRVSIFPHVGGPFTMKSFCLTAMAGLGNLPGILISGITLGIAEAIVQSIPGYSGWSDLVFFGVLILVIALRAYRRSER